MSEIRAPSADPPAPLAGRILVVEDDQDISEVLAYNLKRAGFEVECVDRGDTAYRRIRASAPDLLILDLMLPGLDGLEMTRLLRREKETANLPILMLSARTEEVDRIVGLELGADDYLAKPFSPREVVLRVQAILRRRNAGNPSPGPEPLRIGGLEVDFEGHRLWVQGEEVHCTATELRLLRLLIERQGRVQTRGLLLEEVWGYTRDVESRTVDTHVRRLRAKLGSEGDRIETVVGVGYRFRRD